MFGGLEAKRWQVADDTEMELSSCELRSRGGALRVMIESAAAFIRSLHFYIQFPSCIAQLAQTQLQFYFF